MYMIIFHDRHHMIEQQTFEAFDGTKGTSGKLKVRLLLLLKFLEPSDESFG